MSSTSSRPSSRPRSPSAPATSRPQSRHEVRLVPYTPPRISIEDIPTSVSRPVSYADADDPSSPPSSPSTIPNVDVYPWDSVSPSPARPPARLRRYSSIISNASSAGTPGNDEPFVPSRESSRPPSSSSARPPRRIININVNSDKTFSLRSQRISGSATSRTDSFGLSQTTVSSSFGRSSSASYADPFASSLTTLPEFPTRPISKYSYSYSPGLEEPYPYPVDSPSDSPLDSPSLWHREHAGELGGPSSRPTVDPKGKQPLYYGSSEAASSPLQEALPLPSEHQDYQVATKTSLQSFGSLSTASETTNYKTYGQSSPMVPPGPTASLFLRRHGSGSVATSSKQSANYVVIGGSSHSGESLREHAPDSTSEYDSDANYVIHAGSNASFASVVPVKSQKPKSEYSRESLTVAPLQPLKKRSLAKSSSRESLRSLTSLSSLVAHEAAISLFTGAPSLHLPASLSKTHSRAPSASASANQSIFGYSHPWSKALSTVMSESEGADGASRIMSPFTAASVRQSSGFHSLGGSQYLSSSYGTTSAVPRSLSQSLSVPRECLVRQPSSNSLRMIRDYDEDGDGLAELEELYPRHFRTRRGGALSHSSSRQSLRRINSLRSSLPTWARVYYSSGEPKTLVSQTSMESLMSEYVDSHGRVFSMSRSPSTERPVRALQQHSHLQTAQPSMSSHPGPSRKPRLSQGSRRSWRRSLLYRNPDTQHDSLEIRQNRLLEVAKVIKRKTSSVWSPHLQQDKRISDYSFWSPPPARFVTDRKASGRRNMQIVLFFLGFFFPFAWMLGAVLPLPPKPRFNLIESTSTVNLPPEEATLQVQKLRSAYYHGAQWWRTLNRGMSIIGFAVVVTAITLLNVGLRQQWGR